MPQWVRPLNQSTGAEWHAARVRSFTTTAYCGKVLSRTIELASEEKAERETRCPQCMKSLAPSQVVTPPTRVTPRKQVTPANKAQAKGPAKPTPKKSARKTR